MLKVSVDSPEQQEGQVESSDEHHSVKLISYVELSLAVTLVQLLVVEVTPDITGKHLNPLSSNT